MKCQPSGPTNARIMVVGEAPGAEEEERGLPFVGASGNELTRMLHDSGIPRESCWLTNVARFRPPNNDISKFFLDAKQSKPGPILVDGINELKREIETVRPNIIIALGNVPMWALTGHRGITSWRGSIISSTDSFRPTKVLPTYHPAAIMRQWDWRFIGVHDMRRAARESEYPEIRTPPYQFTIRPSFNKVREVLVDLSSRADTGRLRLALDIETRGGHIACLGIAWSALDALCIPFMCVERPTGYWTVEEEFAIIRMVQQVVNHRNVQIVGQNFIYDNQYIARYWGFAIKVSMDTMLAHHVCWPGLPKGLDFLSSMYCAFHRYWKDEGKTWNRDVPEEQLWRYNCIDCVTTWEISHALDATIDKLRLHGQFQFQMRMFDIMFKTMLRGVAVDLKLRNELAMELINMIAERQRQTDLLTGVNLRGDKGGYSPKKLAQYFYQTLHLPEQRSRKTGKPTCDEDALKELARREPIIRRLVYSIIEARSLGTSLSVVQAPLGPDKRIRCSYNVAGTITFRFSSSEDAFGSGTNLQNITVGKESPETNLRLPNLRRLFKQDNGKRIINIDLERADLQIVVWESDDAELKRALREGFDIHLYTARDVYGLRYTDDDLRNPDAVSALKQQYYWKRHAAKEFVHATDYGGKARTVSFLIGETAHVTERLQAIWFARHPNILHWQQRVRHQLMTTREIRNIFGNRIFFFGRIEELLPEALAWIPQSTIALVINRGIDNADRNIPEAELLLQVHDSATLQVPRSLCPDIYSPLRQQFLIPLPYPDPLTIPVTFSVSDSSWGEVEDVHLS